jgi:hypothetical protein
MNKMVYSYAVLRYVHDTITDEYLNVGVVLLVPSERYAKARIQHEYARLSKTFNGFNGEYFRKLVRHVETKVNSLPAIWSAELEFAALLEDARSAGNIVLPDDDSSLQFSEPRGGLTADPDRTLGELFERHVLRNQPQPGLEPRSHEEVWKTFRNELGNQDVLSALQPVVINGSSFEYEFSHAWKNAKWHPLEPISMDAKEGETLRDRAIKWVGRTIDLQVNDELGTLYLLLGRPQSESLTGSYNKARDLLHKMPIKHEIVEEDAAADFASFFSGLIKRHAPEDQ